MDNSEFFKLFQGVQFRAVRPGAADEATERPRDDDAIIERHEQSLTEMQKEYLAKNGYLIGAVGMPLSKDFFQIHVPVACNMEDAMAQLVENLKAQMT